MKLLGTRPERRVVLSFAGTIAVGAALLVLPASGAHGSVGLLNALFTATSSVCVTGLIVVDTATAFSRFGQAVILVLIQLGGLGMMTLATALLMSLDSRLSFRHRFTVTQSLTADHRLGAPALVRAVVMVALVFEAAGAVLLYPRFAADHPPALAAWHAVFHAVSAFCNAGFSTFSTSLEAYAGDPYVLLVVGSLIVCGGLGFVVIRELVVMVRTRRVAFSLHTKVCLGTTAVLLAAGTAGFWVAERGDLLRDLGPFEGAVNAFFQSLTTRTAGFNALDQTRLTETSVSLAMLLMFIGACPGSTGGGIKTTTFAILTLSALARLMGQRHPNLFKRRVSVDSQQRAVTVMLLAVGLLGLMFTLLMFLDAPPVRPVPGHDWFVQCAFEAVSAFATVGLSLGATPALHAGGKIVIMVLMFVGRVGLLTLAVSLARGLREGQLAYPSEDVMVG